MHVTNHLDVWQRATNTKGVDHDYFLQYNHLSQGLITRIAMNLKSHLPSSSSLAPRDIGQEKKFYFCIGCKQENISKVEAIFKERHPLQEMTQGTINFSKERGLILWVTLNHTASQNLRPILQTLCNAEIWGSDALPQTIADAFIEKVEVHFPNKKTSASIMGEKTPVDLM
jgi:hypothetical protein